MLAVYISRDRLAGIFFRDFYALFTTKSAVEPIENETLTLVKKKLLKEFIFHNEVNRANIMAHNKFMHQIWNESKLSFFQSFTSQYEP